MVGYELVADCHPDSNKVAIRLVWSTISTSLNPRVYFSANLNDVTSLPRCVWLVSRDLMPANNSLLRRMVAQLFPFGTTSTGIWLSFAKIRPRRRKGHQS